jgi:hypothetical protein
MAFQLTSSLVGPGVKDIYGTLNTLFSRFVFQQAVMKSNLKYAIDVISEALIATAASACFALCNNDQSDKRKQTRPFAHPSCLLELLSHPRELQPSRWPFLQRAI